MKDGALKLRAKTVVNIISTIERDIDTFPFDLRTSDPLTGPRIRRRHALPTSDVIDNGAPNRGVKRSGTIKDNSTVLKEGSTLSHSLCPACTGTEAHGGREVQGGPPTAIRENDNGVAQKLMPTTPNPQMMEVMARVAFADRHNTARRDPKHPQARGICKAGPGELAGINQVIDGEIKKHPVFSSDLNRAKPPTNGRPRCLNTELTGAKRCRPTCTLRSTYLAYVSWRRACGLRTLSSLRGGGKSRNVGSSAPRANSG